MQELRALGPLGSTLLQLQQASQALAAAELGRLMAPPGAPGAPAGAKAKPKAEPKAEVKGPPGGGWDWGWGCGRMGLMLAVKGLTDIDINWRFLAWGFSQCEARVLGPGEDCEIL